MTQTARIAHCNKRQRTTRKFFSAMTTMPSDPQKTPPFAVPKRDRRNSPRSLDWSAGLAADNAGDGPGAERSHVSDPATMRKPDATKS